MTAPARFAIRIPVVAPRTPLKSAGSAERLHGPIQTHLIGRRSQTADDQGVAPRQDSVGVRAIWFVLLLVASSAWSTSLAVAQAADDQSVRAPASYRSTRAALPGEVSRFDARTAHVVEQGEKKKEKEKTEEPKKAEPPFAFVFKDRPSFRFGQTLRLDVRLLVQGEARRSMGRGGSSEATFDLTRRRLGIEGTLLRVFEYEVEKELETDGAWRDVFVNVRPASFVQARAGKFKVPLGLEELTSPRDRDFAYRALVITEVAPQRALGFMVHGRLLGRRVHYEAGVFDSDGENSPSAETPPYALVAEPAAASGRSVAGRIRVAPFAGRPGRSLLETLEVGVAVVPSTLVTGMNHFRGHTVLGETFFGRSVYVNGRRMRVGTEMSWTPGPFSVRAEYVRAEEERLGMGVGDEGGLDNDLPPLVTEGWYAAGTWVLTGEKKQGGITPRRPLQRGGAGAIELAVRYDTIRFGAGDTAAAPTTSPRAADIATTSEQVLTVGANWYLNAWLKVQVNAIRERVNGSQRLVGDAAGFWSGVVRLQFSM